MKGLTKIEDASFEAEVLRADQPVLLEVGAKWCPPCRAIEPHLAALAETYGGRLKVLTLDADDSPATAARLGVRGVPTMVVFKGGREVERQLGAVPKTRLVAMVEPHVG
jgi:thioredoxin 1